MHTGRQLGVIVLLILNCSGNIRVNVTEMKLNQKKYEGNGLRRENDRKVMGRYAGVKLHKRPTLCDVRYLTRVLFRFIY